MRKDQDSLGGSDALDALTGREDGQASRAVGISNTVGLDALTIGVGEVSGNAVADLVAKSIIAQNSVGGRVAVSASIGGQGAGSAARVARLAREGAIGSNDLEETGLADAQSISESSVVLSEA